MTARLFSILRRTPSLIDLITPIQPESKGVAFYRLKTDTSPTGTFSTSVVTVPNTGFVDPDVTDRYQNVVQPGENVRIIIKPSNYSLSDTNAFWLKLVFVNAALSEMANPAPGEATLVLPPFSAPTMTGFTATAPTSQRQIDLPRLMDNFTIRNLDTTNGLGVAFQEGGPEVTVPFSSEVKGVTGTVGSFWVRGIGGTVSFSTTFSYATPR